MKIQKQYQSDFIMSIIALFVVGGLVYTGMSALKDGELLPLTSELNAKKTILKN